MKNTFLAEVAKKVYDQYQPDLNHVTVVFPNRRAGLFFQMYLSKLIDKPVWAPTVTTLEDFVSSKSPLQVADPLTLIFELYKAFNSHQTVPETFERFYFWGEMLMKDFEELDKYLVTSDKLFIGIRNQKELDEAFYFLDEKDKKTIQSFWASFLPDASPSQTAFLKTWEILSPVYHTLVKSLKEKDLAYTGLIYREVAEHIQTIAEEQTVVFAGFNALTKSEEVIIKHYVKTYGATVYWDLDSYYFNDEKQEAGSFLREYAKDAVLGNTFPEEPPSYLDGTGRKINVTGVSLEIGQAKAVGELIKEQIVKNQFNPEETIVVLPQEHMLFPLLNSIPEEVSKLNVTMGYPLKETPLFSLIESILQLQSTLRLEQNIFLSFYHKPVIEILSHPYIGQSFPKETEELMTAIRKSNKIMIAQEELTKDNEFFELIFQGINGGTAWCDYLVSILKFLYQTMDSVLDLEKEYLYHFYQILNRLKEILALHEADSGIEIDTFIKLFRQISRSIKIPFEGEPLEGLQIMGVLETRNLDFEHVIMLSMNEGSLPADAKSGSFIPYNIRKAFGIPTFEQQDAIYSYLFYRLIQRANQLDFYHNTTSEFGLNGEVSRYVRQLELESTFTLNHQLLANNASLSVNQSITIEKDNRVVRILSNYLSEGRSRFSPSALNTYLDCKLRFYFRYVAKLYAPDDVQEEMDAAMFGNILHRAMEFIYDDLTKKRKPKRIVESTDFFALKSSIDVAIKVAFQDYYHLPKNRELVLEGRNLVMFEVMEGFMKKVLEHDEKYAPFEIISLEGGSKEGYKIDFPLADGRKVGLKGIIDRIDKKEGIVRVLDYKSGKDDRNVGSKDVFFDRESKKRNKAAMQTFYYAMLYINKHGDDEIVKPGIFNMRELFQEDFDESLIDNELPLNDIRPYMEAFKDNLGVLLEEIYDQNDSFTQTEDTDKCKFCDYNGICRKV